MVAKISRGSSLKGALNYNLSKVNEQKGCVLLLNNMYDPAQGVYSVSMLAHSFEPYLVANQRTEKPIIHISLNPDPSDKVDDDTFKKIATEYMQAMGYGNQPFIVFKHTDIDRTHIHIVSVCVNEHGKKIDDKFEHRRSMDVCRAIEQRYQLHRSMDKKPSEDNKIFNPVEYKKGDVKSQLAAVVRYLPDYYHFTNLGTYNALLSLFNIMAEEVKGEFNGQVKTGLVYFALNETGEKVSNPFKASLFGKKAGYVSLQDHFVKSKELLKGSPTKKQLAGQIYLATKKSKDQAQFLKMLQAQGIDMVIRRNKQNRIYGVTFIDHKSKSVWNGSQLDKGLSANIFEDWFTHGKKPVPLITETQYNKQEIKAEQSFILLEEYQKEHIGTGSMFDFLWEDMPALPEENMADTALAKKKRKRRKKNIN